MGLVAGLCAVAIFVVSVLPVNVKVRIPHLDKVAHLCEYLVFAWVLTQAVRASRMTERDYLVWAWIYATTYGLLIEVLQMFLPWRSASIMDAFMNALGAALGVWIGRWWPAHPPTEA